MSSDRRLAALASNTAVIGLGALLSKGLAFLLVPFVSFFLSPDDFGKYDLAATVIALLVPAITLQLEQALFRFVLDDSTRSARYFTPAFALVATLAMLAGGIVYWVGALVLSPAFALPLAVYFVALACYTCCIECVRGLGLLRTYALFNVLSSILVLIAAIGLVWWLELGVIGLLWSFAFPYLILTICLFPVALPWQFGRLRGASAGGVLREMLAYSSPLVPNVLAFWVVNVSDRVLISYFLGVGANGLYAVGARVPTLLSMFFGVFNISFQQTAVLSVGDRDRERFFGRLFVQSGRFLSGVACAVTGLSPLVFRTLFSAGFAESYRYVPGLVLGTLFLSLAQYIGNLLIAFRRTRIVGASTLAAAFLNVSLNLVLIPVVGAQAAVFSTIVAYLFMLLFRYRVVGFALVTRGDLKHAVLAIIGYFTTSLVTLLSSGLAWDFVSATVGCLAFLLLSGKLALRVLRLGKA